MIVLDTDILIVDLRFPRDPRFSSNRRFLDDARNRLPLAITCQTLLEVVGKLSFSVRVSDIRKLADKIPLQFGLQVLPSLSTFPAYANCSVDDVLTAIGQRMALGDAVNAVQISKFASNASCLLTWNSKHYQGKLVVPSLTPDEWWQQNRLSP